MSDADLKTANILLDGLAGKLAEAEEENAKLRSELEKVRAALTEISQLYDGQGYGFRATSIAKEALAGGQRDTDEGLPTAEDVRGILK